MNIELFKIYVIHNETSLFWSRPLQWERAGSPAQFQLLLSRELYPSAHDPNAFFWIDLMSVPGISCWEDRIDSSWWSESPAFQNQRIVLYISFRNCITFLCRFLWQFFWCSQPSFWKILPKRKLFAACLCARTWYGKEDRCISNQCRTPAFWMLHKGQYWHVFVNSVS